MQPQAHLAIAEEVPVELMREGPGRLERFGELKRVPVEVVDADIEGIDAPGTEWYL